MNRLKPLDRSEMVLDATAADALRNLWTYEAAELATFGRPLTLPAALSLPQSALDAIVPATLAVALSPLAFVFSRRIALSSLTTLPAPWSVGIADPETARLPRRKALRWLREGRHASVARIVALLRVLCS